jgi:hypothetical protein
MERKAFAVWLLLTGALLGLLGDIFFYGKGIGLSFPLFVLVVMGVVLASGWRVQKLLNHPLISFRNLWPLIPLGFFALMVAVRGDSFITFLNLVAVLMLGGLVMHYLPLSDHIDDAPLTHHARGVLESGIYLIPGALFEVVDSWGWLREKRLLSYRPVYAVGRGLLFAVPVVLVFGVLLASADLVFADYINNLFEIFSFDQADALMGHGFLTGSLAWIVVGGLAYGFGRRFMSTQPLAAEAGENTEEDAAHPPKRGWIPLQLGVIESGIILGSVNLLFMAFVLIQMTYLFGGASNVTVDRFTYADYARRGFFELVAVAGLTLGMILFLDYVTVREGKRENMIFRALSILIVGLTGVLLVSASRRMLLYEEAYGFTHLRVYTHVFMLWLGILLGVSVLSLFRLRQNIFSLGMILVTVGYLGTLNLMDVDLYIAERNIARYHENGRKLDIAFLEVLSVDAVPAMVDLYLEANQNMSRSESAEIVERVGQWLAWQLYGLDQMYANMTLFSANLGRDRAWTLLNSIRDMLPEYDFTYSRAYF